MLEGARNGAAAGYAFWFTTHFIAPGATASSLIRKELAQIHLEQSHLSLAQIRTDYYEEVEESTLAQLTAQCESDSSLSHCAGLSSLVYSVGLGALAGAVGGAIATYYSFPESPRAQ